MTEYPIVKAPPPLLIDEDKLTHDRFVQLFVLAFAGASGMLMWLSTAPCADTLSDYFEVSTFVIQFQNAAFYMGALIGIPIVFRFWNDPSIGIRSLAKFSVTAITIGSFIRLFSFDQSPYGYAVLVLGNLVAGLAAGMMIGLATNNSMVWFGPSDQTTATGLTLCGTGLGSASGYLMGALWIYDPSSVGNWLGMNIVIFVFAAISACLVWILIEDRPLKAPSIASSSEQQSRKDLGNVDNFFKEDGIMRYASPFFWVFLVQCVLGVSVYFTVQTTLQVGMQAQGYARSTQNATGITFEFVGLIGTIGFSYLTDYFNIKRVGSVICWSASLLLFVLLGEYITSDALGTSDAGLYVLSGAASIAFSSVPPITLSLLCNTMFPLPAILVTVFVFFLAQLATIIVLLVSQSLGSPGSWFFLYAVLGLAWLLSWTNLWLPLRRDETEAAGRAPTYISAYEPLTSPSSATPTLEYSNMPSLIPPVMKGNARYTTTYSFRSRSTY